MPLSEAEACSSGGCGGAVLCRWSRMQKHANHGSCSTITAMPCGRKRVWPQNPDTDPSSVTGWHGLSASCLDASRQDTARVRANRRNSELRGAKRTRRAFSSCLSWARNLRAVAKSGDYRYWLTPSSRKGTVMTSNSERRAPAWMTICACGRNPDPQFLRVDRHSR